MAKRTRQRSEAHADGHVIGHEAADICGATYRQVTHWAKIGVAPPAIPAVGSGHAHRYGLDQLVRLRVAVDLYGLGLSGSGHRSRRTELVRLLDRVDYGGGPVSLQAGSVTVIVDPAAARRQIENAYLATIGVDGAQ